MKFTRKKISLKMYLLRRLNLFSLLRDIDELWILSSRFQKFGWNSLPNRFPTSAKEKYSSKKILHSPLSSENSIGAHSLFPPAKYRRKKNRKVTCSFFAYTTSVNNVAKAGLTKQTVMSKLSVRYRKWNFWSRFILSHSQGRIKFTYSGEWFWSNFMPSAVSYLHLATMVGERALDNLLPM